MCHSPMDEIRGRSRPSDVSPIPYPEVSSDIIEHVLNDQTEFLRRWTQQLEEWNAQNARWVRVLENWEERFASRPGAPCAHNCSAVSVAMDQQEKAELMHATRDMPGYVPAEKPYPNRAFAAGLQISHSSSEKNWRPAWVVFPLKAFRGCNYTFVRIQSHWDDEQLLRELRRVYDKLRTPWRKWFSLKSVR